MFGSVCGYYSKTDVGAYTNLIRNLILEVYSTFFGFLWMDFEYFYQLLEIAGLDLFLIKSHLTI